MRSLLAAWLRPWAWMTLVLLGTVTTEAARAEIRVENLAEGETLRYPVALIRGTVEGDGPLAVTNADRPGAEGTTQGTVGLGRFTALVELKPGPNRLSLAAGEQRCDLTLHYRPMTTPYQVKVVYVTDRDGHTDYITQKDNDPQNYRERLDTAAKLLQTFTAEAMREQGHGRQTFALELDDQGRVVVHTERYPAAGEALRAQTGDQLYGRLYGWIGRKFPMDRTKAMVLMGFSGYDPQTKQAQAHTALGGGGQGLFSNLFLFCWPASLADVPRAFSDATPVDRSKVYHDVGLPTLHTLASTTLGAVLHEMGHTFGLPHTADPRCIMSRGFDNLRLNFLPADLRPEGLTAIQAEQTATFSPYMAARLARSPWFAPDAVAEATTEGPRLRFDWARQTLEVEAPGGLEALLTHTGEDQVEHGVVTPIAVPATRLSIPLAELRARHPQSASGGTAKLTILAYDRQRREASLDTSRAKDPAWFLSRWRLLEQPVGLPDPKGPAPTAAQLQTLRETLQQREPRELPRQLDGPLYSADLTQVYSPSSRVATFALGELTIDRDRPARLLVGGDDGVRVWLNGELVIDRPGSLAIAPDTASATVQLRQGRNEILVQSQQAGGDWGFALRLTDPDGTPLGPGSR